MGDSDEDDESSTGGGENQCGNEDCESSREMVRELERHYEPWELIRASFVGNVSPTYDKTVLKYVWEFIRNRLTKSDCEKIRKFADEYLAS